MTHLIRDIQIDLILGNTNPIIDFFNAIWSDLSVCETYVYHNNGGEIIYYNSRKEWIFYRDDKNDKFWCSYDRYWREIKLEFDLEYGEIKIITKLLVENALDVNVANILNLKQLQQLPIQKALNIIIPTPTTARYSPEIEACINKI